MLWLKMVRIIGTCSTAATKRRKGRGCGLLANNVVRRLKEIGTALTKGSIKRAEDFDVSRLTGNAKPPFELWDEGDFHGTLDVAMDGTVLMFMVLGGEKGDGIYVKRSEDGGATWSDDSGQKRH